MKKRDLRTIWSSNAIWTNSGYGIEMRDLLTRLVADGWPTAQSSFFGLDSYPITYEGIKVYPKMADPFGSDAMVAHAFDYKANAVFSMQDLSPLNPKFLQQIRTWIPWVPIDYDPIPPSILDRLRYAYKIITFSRFGQKLLEKAGFISDLIVEGTDVNIFKPFDKKECRKKLQIPDDVFLFGMIGANKENPPRKGYQEALEAFKLFHDVHPESALFFHTQQMAPGGFPIIEFARYLGIAKRIFFMNTYKGTFGSSSKEIAEEINACDVILHPSHTEGFGLVIIEAQACGKPVIVSNSMSMPELVIEGKTGELVDIAYKRWTNLNGYAFIPDVKSIYWKMEKIYKQLQDKNTYEKDCREWITNNYNIDTLVKEKWIPYFEQLQDNLLIKDQQKNQLTTPPLTQ